MTDSIAMTTERTAARRCSLPSASRGGMRAAGACPHLGGTALAAPAWNPWASDISTYSSGLACRWMTQRAQSLRSANKVSADDCKAFPAALSAASAIVDARRVNVVLAASRAQPHRSAQS